MQGIFISYRRQDSQSAAGRLADHVKENMPGIPVFRDVETIEPGVDFTEAINRALQSCGVLLAVIGPHWMSLTDAAGRRDNPNDYTRLEIATALARPNVRVIPVLVEGAQMPEPGGLPEDLQTLCRRHAIELTDKRWNFDVSQLIEALRKALDIKPPTSEPRPHSQPAPEPVQPAWYRRLSKKQWGGIAAAVVVLGILGGQEFGSVDTGTRPPPLPVYPSEHAAPITPVEQLDSTLAPRHKLEGTWLDAEGGEYCLWERKEDGSRYDIFIPNFPKKVGVGEIDNNILLLDYNLGGVQYSAKLEISADGKWLRGRYINGSTGESGVMVLEYKSTWRCIKV